MIINSETANSLFNPADSENIICWVFCQFSRSNDIISANQKNIPTVSISVFLLFSIIATALEKEVIHGMLHRWIETRSFQGITILLTEQIRRSPMSSDESSSLALSISLGSKSSTFLLLLFENNLRNSKSDAKSTTRIKSQVTPSILGNYGSMSWVKTTAPHDHPIRW